ncbi:hypothetical protein CYY_000840 [Polysphondylium violaceum]|uniref:Kinetochore protein Nuf2 N-terminal domain-containing protein n=1 Tax=Polysphondylium violaceum TaxID=133409 RepID=A0A8J4V582_9MYCE|nr:hypothetical protein CYY_000840 [Polysphondylium violaceum]
MNARKKHSFKVLQLDQLIENLHRQGATHFSREDIEHPKEEKIRHFYETCLRQFIIFKRTDPPSFKEQQALSELYDYQIYEDAISEVKFYKKMEYFMKIIGIHDFDYSDVYSPVCSRTIRIFCALVNYSIFWNVKLLVWQQYEDASVQLMQDRQKVLEREQQVESKWKCLGSVKEAKEKQAQELRNGVGEIENQLFQYKKDNDDWIREKDEMVKTTDDMNCDYVKSQTSLANGVKEIDELQSLVLSSPERVIKELNQRKEAIQCERDKILIQCKENSVLVNRLDLFQDISRAIQKIMAKVNEVATMHSLLQNHKRALKSAKHTLQHQKTVTADLDLELKKIKSDIINIENREKESLTSFNDNKKELFNTLKKIEEERIHLELDNKRIDLEIKENNRKKNELEDAMKSLSLQYYQQDKILFNQYIITVQSLKVYHQKLEKKLNPRLIPTPLDPNLIH